jgi:hypothetical protein
MKKMKKARALIAWKKIGTAKSRSFSLVSLPFSFFFTALPRA